MFDIGAPILTAIIFALQAVGGADGYAAICQSLEAHECASVDTGLSDIRLSEVDGFDTDAQVVVHGITDAGIELSSVFLYDRKAPGEAGSAAEIGRTVRLTPRITHPG